MALNPISLTLSLIELVSYRIRLLDVTCESLSFRSRRPGLPLSGKPRTRGSGIHLHARERRDREQSRMVESRAETAILSDKTEFTETQDQSRTHQRAEPG